MESLLVTTMPDSAPAFWRNPTVWFQQQNLGRGYWIFFSAAFFYDAGFSIYFFLFNLYLLDRGFNERAMGWIGGAMTLGSLVATLPAGALARKLGVRPLLMVLFLAAPCLNAARAAWTWLPAQIALAFLAGVVMSAWGVCFLPAVTRLTTERNRTTGFSLIFLVSVGTNILGGVVCGYLGQWLSMAGFVLHPADVKRLILLASCAVACLGIVPVLRLRSASLATSSADAQEASRANWLSQWKLHPFLLRFLPTMALWSAVLIVFGAFANIFLARDLHVPMAQIGLVFSAVQLVQLCVGLATPAIFRVLGLVNGIAATQVIAAITLGSMALAHRGGLAIALYLVFSAAQWASSPGLYNLLMNETPDQDRSTAAAMTMFANSLAGSAATALAGVLFTRFGYPPVLLGIAALAFVVSLLFRLLIPRVQHLSLP